MTMNRRTFVQKGVLAGVGAIALPHAIRSRPSINGMLNIAFIGVGGIGASTLRNIASHERVRVVALCDVDAEYLAAALKEFPEARGFKDWRELLTSNLDLDACAICTPDHMHAAPAVIALRRGLHVYLQKPMAPTVHECRVIATEARAAGVVTQLGNQWRSSIESRMTVDLLASGAIGRVREVIMWENKKLNWWPEVENAQGIRSVAPAGFEWDLWLGVREERPFVASAYHPKMWRAWVDFGIGGMGDMGCHFFDTSVEALKLEAPVRVRQETPGGLGGLWGKERILEMEFKGNDRIAGDVLKVAWYDGGYRPRIDAAYLPKSVNALPESGTIWIGERGAIYKNFRGGRPFVLPEAEFPPERYPRGFEGRNHYHDWINACRDGRRATSDFEHGSHLSEIVLIGALADRSPGEWLDWNAGSMKFTNGGEINQYVKRRYRKGWEISGLG